MSNKVSDYAQREQALNPAGSFIVQAPAGSGKTELLIQRYLKILGLIEYPEEIIAITFTRKAAAEMQGRIVNALERARNNVPPEDDATSLTDELARTVLIQDQKYNWQLQNNPGRMRIQTIDSLCAWLTRQMPILSRFGAQPETLEDASELYLEAAEQTLSELESDESWSDDIALLLGHLDNNLPKVKQMLAHMLAKRDQWLRHVEKEIHRDEFESALKHIVESTLSLARQSFPKEHELEFLECVRHATENLAREDADTSLLVCHGIDHLPGTTAIELPRWQALVEFCLTKNNEWRKRADKNLGFPVTKDSKPWKDRFQALLSHLSGDHNLLNLLIEVRHLPPVTYTNSEWRIVQALCQLLRLADGKLRQLFGAQNQMDFNGITRAAIGALQTDQLPTNLALHLDYQIKHLLVDEFQDVSNSQYQLLQQLTAGWSPEDGHSLFLVGDPMQSIYRFRQAEVGLFINTWNEKRLDQVPLMQLTISVNFRSQAGIVNWVNDAFRQVLPENSDAARGAVEFSEAIAFHKERTTDAVIVHPLIAADSQAEASKVLALIQSTRQTNPDGNIAILVRNRTHLMNIVPLLKQAGIKFRAVDIDPLGHLPAIQDLLALTRALQHFANRIAWLAVLRAPWCGLTLTDLLILVGRHRYSTVWECIHNDELVKKISRDGQQRILKIRAVMQLYFSSQRRRTLRRSVQSVWMSLGGPATLGDETDLENAETFFDLLDEYDIGGELKNQDEFSERVEKLFAVPDVNANEQLQIMTIHKAKGLEFDTVIVPGLHRAGRHDDPPLLWWTENPYGQRQDFLLAPVREAGQTIAPIYDFVKRLEQERKFNEQARLLYVAATRAKRQLHLLASIPINSKGEMGNPASDSLLKHLWPVVDTQFQKVFERHQISAVQPNQSRQLNPAPLRRLTSDWVLPIYPKSVVWPEEMAQAELPDTMPEYEWAGETIKHTGTIVHRCIQMMAEEGIEHWNESYIKSMHDRFEGSLKRLGVQASELRRATRNVEDALLGMISDERGQWLLAKEHTEAQNEYALTGVYHGRVINIKIDRTFVDREGTRWVIDYKTTPHTGKDLEAFLIQQQQRHLAQLVKYGTLIQSVDNRPVKLGLYFPLLQSWREIAM